MFFLVPFVFVIVVLVLVLFRFVVVIVVLVLVLVLLVVVAGGDHCGVGGFCGGSCGGSASSCGSGSLISLRKPLLCFKDRCSTWVSRPMLLYSRNLFQREENIVFSQVHVLHVSLVPFFLFPNSQLIPKCTKHCFFTGTCCMCLSSHFFYSLIRNLFQNARNIVFSQVNVACVFRPIFSIP